MRRTREPMSLSLPPFTKAVTWLIGINTGVFLLMGLLSMARISAGAYLEYYGYATGAEKERFTNEANVWRTVGDVEHQDHYTHEVTLLALFSETDNAANLEFAITQAQQVAQRDFARAAQNPASKAARVCCASR